MTVAELIAELAKMPQDANVMLVWDGGARSEPEMIWVAQGGSVLLGPLEYPLYYDKDRPPGAPTSKENVYWSMRDGVVPKPGTG